MWGDDLQPDNEVGTNGKPWRSMQKMLGPSSHRHGANIPGLEVFQHRRTPSNGSSRRALAGIKASCTSASSCSAKRCKTRVTRSVGPLPGSALPFVWPSGSFPCRTTSRLDYSTVGSRLDYRRLCWLFFAGSVVLSRRPLRKAIDARGP